MSWSVLIDKVALIGDMQVVDEKTRGYVTISRDQYPSDLDDTPVHLAPKVGMK